MPTHRCVQIGCGSRARTHARALTESDRFDLGAVCDLDRSRAAETDPTHVSIVTSPPVRLSVVTDVLEHDVDSILLEKPLANSLEEAGAIADALSEAGVRGTVCHQKPWGDDLRGLGRGGSHRVGCKPFPDRPHDGVRSDR